VGVDISVGIVSRVGVDISMDVDISTGIDISVSVDISVGIVSRVGVDISMGVDISVGIDISMGVNIFTGVDISTEIDRSTENDRSVGSICAVGSVRIAGKPVMTSVDLTESPSSSLGFSSKASWRITEPTSSLFSCFLRARRLVLVASPNRERERRMGSNKIKTNRAMAEMMNDMMSRVSRKYIETTAAAGKKS